MNMKLNNAKTILISLMALAVWGCDDKVETSKADSTAASSADATSSKSTKKEEKPAAKPKAAVPTCDKVVDHFASFDKNAGAPERKLWAAMCKDMTDAQKTCVIGMKGPGDMKACMEGAGKPLK